MTLSRFVIESSRPSTSTCCALAIAHIVHGPWTQMRLAGLLDGPLGLLLLALGLPELPRGLLGLVPLELLLRPLELLLRLLRRRLVLGAGSDDVDAGDR